MNQPVQSNVIRPGFESSVHVSLHRDNASTAESWILPRLGGAQRSATSSGDLVTMGIGAKT